MPVLNNVRDFMGEQMPACGGMGLVLSGVKDDSVAHRVSQSIDCRR